MMLRPAQSLRHVLVFRPTLQTPINLCHVSASQHSVIPSVPATTPSARLFARVQVR